MKKSIKIFKKISFIFAIIITILVIIFAIFFISEFRPKQTQKLILNGNAKSSSLNSKEFKIITWNIGYASLGKNADFFMDGGKMVQTSTKNQII